MDSIESTPVIATTYNSIKAAPTTTSIITSIIKSEYSSHHRHFAYQLCIETFNLSFTERNLFDERCLIRVLCLSHSKSYCSFSCLCIVD